MKPFISVLMAIIFYQFLISGQTDQQKLRISKLTNNFYVYTTWKLYDNIPYPSNGMYLVTDSGVALFDTPWDESQFQPLLDSIKNKHHKDVVLCISTHSHSDRTAGLDYYKNKGIKTYTTQKIDSISKIKNEKRAELLIYHDTVFILGNYRFQTYYGGEGHSPDNIVIWFGKDRILYGGCLVKSTEASELGNLADANVYEWENTIEKIMNKFKNPKYIIPGHQSWENNRSLEHTLKLLSDFKDKK